MGRIIKDYNGLDFKNPDHVKKFGQAVAIFLSLPSDYVHNSVPQSVEMQNFRSKKQQLFELQNISQIDDFVERINTLMGEFKTMPQYDEGYKTIFDMAPLEMDSGWDVRTTVDRIVFSEIKEGGSISYYGYGDAVYRVYVRFYGGGVGIDRQTLLQRRYAEVEELIMRLRNAAYEKKAAVAYALIETISAGQNIAWQTTNVATTDRAYTALRDANTIDLATRTAYENCKDKGYLPRGLATPFIILYPYQIDKRIRAALTVPFEGYSGSDQLLNFNYVTVKTDMLTVPDKYYVCIPKAKAQGRDLLDLSQFMNFNQDNFQEQIADWMSFGFNIGDEQQFQRCSIA